MLSRTEYPPARRPGPYTDPVASVLLVEDDSAIAEPLVRALEREGHGVAVEADGIAGAATGTHGTHDLVILDLGLPGLDGLEVCRRIRTARPTVPILVLTARSDEIDAIIGLDAGADDYQAKPFRLGELMARVRALVRRGAAPEAAGGVRVDEPARRAFAGENELALTPKEFDLLALLIREAGRVVRRERIMEEVWDDERRGSTKTLDMHVSSLRRKLGDDPSRPRLLRTVRGVGLRFEAA
jgi:DNA-binding response OmpR family regulator